MIRSRLGVLLAERRISAAKVSKDTGISRNTLSLITSNSAKGIQYDTMNTLCTYLGINPGELFLFVPFDISFARPSISGTSIEFIISDRGRVKRYKVPIEVTGESTVLDDSDEDHPYPSNTLIPKVVRVYAGPYSLDDVGPIEADKETRELITYLKKLPTEMWTAIKSELRNQLLHDGMSEIDALTRDFPEDYTLQRLDELDVTLHFELE